MRIRKGSAALLIQFLAVIAGLCTQLTSAHAQGAQEQKDSASPTMTLTTPADMPLQLTDVQSFVASAGPSIRMLRYSLRNAASRAIVADTIQWQCYRDGDGKPCGAIVTPYDCWGEGECYAPGEEKTLSMAGPFAGVRLEGIPVYVEFDNGQRIGSWADSEFSRLTKERNAALDEYKRALVIYSVYGQDALASELAKAEAFDKTDKGRANVGRTLLYEIKQKGLNAAVSDLKLKAELHVPQ